MWPWCVGLRGQGCQKTLWKVLEGLKPGKQQAWTPVTSYWGRVEGQENKRHAWAPCDERAKFHTSGGPRRGPGLSEGRGRRILARGSCERQDLFLTMMSWAWTVNGAVLQPDDAKLRSVGHWEQSRVIAAECQVWNSLEQRIAMIYRVGMCWMFRHWGSPSSCRQKKLRPSYTKKTNPSLSTLNHKAYNFWVCKHCKIALHCVAKQLLPAPVAICQFEPSDCQRVCTVTSRYLNNPQHIFTIPYIPHACCSLYQELDKLLAVPRNSGSTERKSDSEVGCGSVTTCIIRRFYSKDEGSRSCEGYPACADGVWPVPWLCICLYQGCARAKSIHVWL